MLKKRPRGNMWRRQSCQGRLFTQDSLPINLGRQRLQPVTQVPNLHLPSFKPVKTGQTTPPSFPPPWTYELCLDSTAPVGQHRPGRSIKGLDGKVALGSGSWCWVGKSPHSGQPEGKARGQPLGHQPCVASTPGWGSRGPGSLQSVLLRT